MKNGLEYGLTEGAALLKRGRSALLRNMGVLVASLTAIVVVLITFTDVALAELSFERLGATAAVMALATYVIYFSLEDAGERLGEESEEYADAIKEYEEAKRKITPGNVERLRVYLLEYSERDLRLRREGVLLGAGLSEADIEKVNKGLRFSLQSGTRAAKRAVRRARRLRPVMLNPTVLLSGRAKSYRSELKNPERGKGISMAVRMLPALVSVCVTASVILTAKDGLGTAEIIEGILKLSTLPVAAMRGYAAGYEFIRERLVPWIETKTRLINAFLASQGCEQPSCERESFC